MTKVADYTINDHTALIEKFEAAECFKDEITQEQCDNLAKYFISLPSEVAMKMWTVLGNGHLNNTIKLHQSNVATENGNRSVVDYLVEILGGETKE